MSVTVVDASAIAAVIFDEPESRPLLAMAGEPLLAPTLIRYELASVCSTKLTRHRGQAPNLLARYRLFDEIAIELVEPDWITLPELALEWSISAYDAAYLQLALLRRGVLLTLDARLAAAFDKASRDQRS